MPKPRNIPAGQLSMFGDDDQPAIQPTSVNEPDPTPIVDELPLPILVSEKWTFALQHHVIDGVYYYAVLDWISGLTGDADTARKTAAYLKKTIGNETSSSTRQLSYIASDNKKYKRDYMTDEGLYLLTQSLRGMKERPAVNEIKRYLAKMGAFGDKMRLDPDVAIDAGNSIKNSRKYAELVRGGMTHAEAMQWISVRGKQPVKTVTLRDTWKARGISGGQYGTLTNVVTQVATGRTATEHKRALKVNNSREGLSAYENAVITVVETVSDILHNARDSHGIDELTIDIQDSDNVVNRDELARQMSKKRPRLIDGGN